MEEEKFVKWGTCGFEVEGSDGDWCRLRFLFNEGILFKVELVEKR